MGKSSHAMSEYQCRMMPLDCFERCWDARNVSDARLEAFRQESRGNKVWKRATSWRSGCILEGVKLQLMRSILDCGPPPGFDEQS